MTRRLSGSGTVRTLRRTTVDTPGRYQALGPRLPDGRRISLYCGPDRALAEACAERGARQLAAGEAVHLTGTTLRAYAAGYLDGRERDAPRSVATERYSWAHIDRAPWAGDPIDSVRTPAIQAHLVALARRWPGAAPGAKAVLSSIFSSAMRAGLVTGNPVAAVKLPRRVRTHEPWTYLLPDEQARLLSAPIPEVDRLLITVWLYTGLRGGEILALRISDVHLDRGTITVRYGSLHGPPKGKRIRTVHLFPPALAALRRQIEILPDYLGSYGNAYGLIFPGRQGGARRVGHALRHHEARVDGRRVARDGWREALAAAGIVASERHDAQAPTGHSLRHTCGASLASGWWTDEPWQMVEIQAHLGHATLRQTERYAHLAPSVVSGKASRVRGVTQPVGHDLAIPAVAAQVLRMAPLRVIDGGSRLDRAPCPSHAPAGAAELCRSALEAAARQDPHAGRLLVEACGAALVVLDQRETGERTG